MCYDMLGTPRSDPVSIPLEGQDPLTKAEASSAYYSWQGLLPSSEDPEMKWVLRRESHSSKFMIWQAQGSGLSSRLLFTVQVETNTACSTKSTWGPLVLQKKEGKCIIPSFLPFWKYSTYHCNSICFPLYNAVTLQWRQPCITFKLSHPVQTCSPKCTDSVMFTPHSHTVRSKMIGTLDKEDILTQLFIDFI
jgi:hypothetical protein